MSWPVDEKVKRIRAARAAIANARLEGREPSPETFALLDRFIAGTPYFPHFAQRSSFRWSARAILTTRCHDGSLMTPSSI